jgi:MoxR-like ATPase
MVAQPRPVPPPAAPLSPAAAQVLLQRIAGNIERAVQGNALAVRLALVALCGRGHLLLEGVPGVGKTSLAQALARSLDLQFSRVQFTSDLLPADIVGATVFDPRAVSFSFRPGPVFAQVVLADELNRAPPRVQSALLEAMGEGQVSSDGGPVALPEPFFVVATQNPREHAGTFPLPDAQLDRFLLRLTLGYPDPASEQRILLARGEVEPHRALQPVAGAAEVAALQAAAAAVHVEPALAGYVVALAERTRAPGFAQGGLSTRGALALLQAAKAFALSDGRGHLLPDDVKAVAGPCLGHRLAPPGGAGFEVDRLAAERLVAQVLADVPVPV